MTRQAENLTERLNQILPTITSEQFLAGDGVGNEIPYHVFEYPPAEELTIREHIRFLLEKLPQVRPNIQVADVNLFDFLIDHLRERNLLERSFEMARKSGDSEVRRRLDAVLQPDKIAPLLAERISPATSDLVLIHGVGSVWPFMRASGLLNSLHHHTGQTPVVMFYPGSYDQVCFRLFGKVRDNDKQDNYYRAFRLVA